LVAGERSSVSAVGERVSSVDRGPVTITFPAWQGGGSSAPPGAVSPEYFGPSYYGSVIPSTPSGPVGQTGPAAVAIMAAGAAMGFAWMRRKRTKDPSTPLRAG
jgi:hypothetical protein